MKTTKTVLPTDRLKTTTLADYPPITGRPRPILAAVAPVCPNLSEGEAEKVLEEVRALGFKDAAAAQSLLAALGEILIHLDAHSRQTVLAGGEHFAAAMNFAKNTGGKLALIPAVKSARAALARTQNEN